MRTPRPEIMRREEARRSLLAFVCYVCPWFKPAAHHALMCNRLEALERKEIDRLMIFMPPRHGKSTIASLCFPAWCYGRDPTTSMIATAYGGDLAAQVGGDVRNLLRDELYREVFPGVELTGDEKARTRWSVERINLGDPDDEKWKPKGAKQGGRYIGAGVGGQITGRGGKILGIDDPVKSREEASSKTMRDRAYRWYTNDFYTRQDMQGAGIFICQTRWDVGDLSGCLLRDMQRGGDQWEVLKLPALAVEDDPLGREPGEPLWPEFFTAERYQRIKKVLTMEDGPQAWESLYQQEPTVEGGNYFKSHWIEPYYYHSGNQPKGMQIFVTSDYAVTAGSGNWTVHIVFGVDARQHIWILDLWRRQTDTLEWCLAWINLTKRWKPIYALEERGQIEKSVGPFLERLIREHDAFMARSSEDGLFTPSTDKGTRARSIAGRMQMGMVHIPADAPWTTDLVDELTHFSGEKGADEQDDQVDALSLIGLYLSRAEGDEDEAPVPKKESDYGHKRSWREELRRQKERAEATAEVGSLTNYVMNRGLSAGWSPDNDDEDDDVTDEDDDE